MAEALPTIAEYAIMVYLRIIKDTLVDIPLT